jgi:hypothetical protein
MKGLLIDDGITCTTMDSLQFARDVKWANGSGFDELDAVAESLGYERAWEPEETSDFMNPLEILIRSEAT